MKIIWTGYIPEVYKSESFDINHYYDLSSRNLAAFFMPMTADTIKIDLGVNRIAYELQICNSAFEMYEYHNSENSIHIKSDKLFKFIYRQLLENRADTIILPLLGD